MIHFYLNYNKPIAFFEAMKTESNFRDIKEISMSDNDFREVIDGEENKEPAASDNNLYTTEAESAEVVNTTADAQESDEKKDDEYEEICYICHRIFNNIRHRLCCNR